MPINENLPPCAGCGSTSYRPGGGTFGHGSTRWFTCERCGREGVEIFNHMGVFILARDKPVPLPLDEYGNAQSTFPQGALDHINTVLTITLRAYEKQIDKAREALRLAAWDFYFDLLGIPRGTVFTTEREPYARVLQTPGGEVIRDEVLIARLDAMLDALHRERCSFPVTCLPKVPDCAVVYVMLRGEWVSVDRAESAMLNVPPDPIRVAHDTYWADVFKQLHDSSALAPEVKPTLTENQYVGARGTAAEPWYTFTAGGRHFLLGPRKRVDSVEVTSETLMDTAKIRALAERDNTTYEAEGGWKSNVSQAKKILIHAGTKEKLVEYVKVLLGAQA